MVGPGKIIRGVVVFPGVPSATSTTPTNIQSVVFRGVNTTELTFCKHGYSSSKMTSNVTILVLVPL